MAALRYILLAAAITLTLALLAHLVLPARGPIPRRTGRRGGLGIAALTAVYAVAAFFSLGSSRIKSVLPVSFFDNSVASFTR